MVMGSDTCFLCSQLSTKQRSPDKSDRTQPSDIIHNRFLVYLLQCTLCTAVAVPFYMPGLIVAGQTVPDSLSKRSSTVDCFCETSCIMDGFAQRVRLSALCVVMPCPCSFLCTCSSLLVTQHPNIGLPLPCVQTCRWAHEQGNRS